MAMEHQGYRVLDKESLREYIKATPSLSSKLCNKLPNGDDDDDIQIEMINEGLMNFVYIVSSSEGSMVIKQALPYIRCMGESFPMSKERTKYEAKALQVYGSLCPSHVPEVYHLDACLSLIAMRYLEPPHILLREGLIAGIQYPLLADHVSHYLATVFFRSSLLDATTVDHQRAVGEFCGNSEMFSLIEQLSLEAFGESQHTSWTSPELDPDVKALHEDNTIKFEVIQLKYKFSERAQALIHADLHAGSIMVTQSSTYVIDPEFAFYGPMGYDIGTFFRNLIVSFFSQDGLATAQNDRQNYKMWLLMTIEETWNLFQQKFLQLWNDKKSTDSGETCSSQIYNNTELKGLLQRKFLDDLLQDSLAFCAAYLIGSVIHVGPVEDFLSIANGSKRVECERRTLNFGKMLLKERQSLNSIGEVVSTLEKFDQIQQSFL